MRSSASRAPARVATAGTLPRGEVLIALEGVERTYRVGANSVAALRGVDLSVQAGTFVILRGRSGSGKTTMLNLMGGLDRPTRGRVTFRGRDLSRMTERELTRWRRQQVGFVFQSFALIQVLTAYENVELPMRIARVRPAERARRVRECLELVGLWSRAGHRTFELSGGEQQRVSIARALANRPSVILADEPTGELDFATGRRVLDLFREIVAREGVTICMATHDPGASEFADVTYQLADGQIRREE
ncbi:MAG TPA: ABC transporter ATP-binding protein [Limnochordia bacterium]